MSVPTLTRTAPVVPATLTVQDSYTAAAWGFTAWTWITLTDSERADYRNRIAYAGK